MPNLMDVLNKKIIDRRNRQMTGGQEAASRLLRAKSGKAVGAGSGPAQTNLGEALAAQTGQQQLDQVQQQSDMASQSQMAQSQQQQDQAAMQAQELGTQKELALVEQQAADEALANKQYLATLDRVGRQSLMRDGLINEEQFVRTQLGDSHNLFVDALGYDELLGKKGVDYNVAQQKLQGYWNNRLGERADSAQQYAQQTQMLSSLIQGGAKMYGAYKSYKDKPAETKQGID